MKRSRDDVLFWAGACLWLAVLAVTWPRALSFGDEVGYVGRAKLLLEGHVRYVPHAVGLWIQTPHGPIDKFPILFSVFLAPLLLVVPRAVFIIPVASAILMALVARAALKSWGKSPLWALLILAHPTIVILARTAMADVPQAAAVLGAWWACKRDRLVATTLALILLAGLKATGSVLAAAVIAGEALTSQAALRARDAAAWRRLGAALLGGVLGFALSLTENYVSNGTLHSGYDQVFQQIKPFSISYLPTEAVVHLKTLLFLPPLLIAGAWPFWRQRDFGPLFIVGGFLTMMFFYFFSDTGATWAETLVLSPRLILPVVAILLVGYGAWLDDLVTRLSPRAGAQSAPVPGWLGAAIVGVTLASVEVVSAKHAHHQRAMSSVRDLASALADSRGERTLGVTENAEKAGALHDGPVRLYDPPAYRPAAVFCSEVSASHRSNQKGASCRLPGYHPVASWDGFVALARDDSSGEAR